MLINLARHDQMCLHHYHVMPLMASAQTRKWIASTAQREVLVAHGQLTPTLKRLTRRAKHDTIRKFDKHRGNLHDNMCCCSNLSLWIYYFSYGQEVTQDKQKGLSVAQAKCLKRYPDQRMTFVSAKITTIN